jgi:hypothetical protein
MPRSILEVGDANVRNAMLKETFVAMLIQEYASQSKDRFTTKRFGRVVPATELDDMKKKADFYWIFPYAGKNGEYMYRERVIAVDVTTM